MHEHHGIAAQGGHPAGWLLLVPLLAALGIYLLAALRLRGSGRDWSWWRTASWAGGIALVAVVVSPPFLTAAHGDLRVHMLQHLSLGVFAPIGLVLAAPMTLVLRSVPVTAGRTISALLRSRPLHVLSHPVTALVLNIGGMYLLYVTPLFARSMERPALHLLISFHVLAAGYLFAWSIAGPDPAPRRPGMAVRTGVLVLGIALHAFLGKLMYAHHLPRGTSFDPEEIRQAALVMYYGGDIGEILLATAFFGGWYLRRRNRRLRIARVAAPITRFAGSTTGE